MNKTFLTLFCFLIFCFNAQAQPYQNVLTNELTYDTLVRQVVFKCTNMADTTIKIPQLSSLSNYNIITAPNGDTFSIRSTNDSFLIRLRAKDEFERNLKFGHILQSVIELTNFRNKEIKRLTPESGVYKIEWLISGLPNKSVLINFDYDESTIEAYYNTICGCGDSYGSYPDVYEVYNNKNSPFMMNKLDIFFNQKDIQKLRDYNYSYDAYNILMRMKDIKWGRNKRKALKYLNSTFKKLLNGESYLTKTNRNVMHDYKTACPYKFDDPIHMPVSCYWVALKIDTDYGLKMIDKTWELLSGDEPYLKNLRFGLLNTIASEKKYFTHTRAQSFLTGLDKNKLSSKEKLRIDELNFKYALYRSENQSDALDILISRCKTNMSKQISIDDVDFFSHSFRFFEEIFGYKIDINRLVELAEIEENNEMKHFLVYACCFVENGMHPDHSEENLCGRISKLITDVQKLNLKILIENNTDYFEAAAKAWREWH